MAARRVRVADGDAGQRLSRPRFAEHGWAGYRRFPPGLRDAGYVDGQSLAIEYRWAEGRYDRLPALATELVDRKVDVILVSGGRVPTLAAKQATSTIRIVFIPGGLPASPGRAATSPASGSSPASCSPSGSNCFSNWLPRQRSSPCSRTRTVGCWSKLGALLMKWGKRRAQRE
jgi:hypothetical protein